MNGGQTHERREPDVFKGLVAGLIGGLVASVVMNQAQKLVGELLTGDKRAHGAQSLQQGAPRRGAGKILEERGVEDPNDDAAERLAQTISVGVFDHELSDDEKNTAGTALHYAYGISMGAVYGVAAEILPETTIGAGSVYASLIWMGADEGVVPLLGLSKSADEYPLSIHACAFASHLVYGLTAEAVRRAVRNAF